MSLFVQKFDISIGCVEEFRRHLAAAVLSAYGGGGGGGGGGVCYSRSTHSLAELIWRAAPINVVVLPNPQ
jgi:hypothetical protein